MTTDIGRRFVDALEHQHNDPVQVEKSTIIYNININFKVNINSGNSSYASNVNQKQSAGSTISGIAICAMFGCLVYMAGQLLGTTHSASSVVSDFGHSFGLW